MDPKENKQGYASEMQRNVLVSLLNNVLIQDNFFLTGGTAFIEFYKEMIAWLCAKGEMQIKRT